MSTEYTLWVVGRRFFPRPLDVPARRSAASPPPVLMGLTSLAGVGVSSRVQGAAGQSILRPEPASQGLVGGALRVVWGAWRHRTDSTRGSQVFLPLWAASCAFLAANVWVLVTVMRRYR
jgi:hypothetical protein